MSAPAPVASSNSTNGAAANSSVGTSESTGPDGSTSSRQGKSTTYLALWDLSGAALDQWGQTIPALQGNKGTQNTSQTAVTPEVARLAWKNLMGALTSLMPRPKTPEGDANNESAMETDDDYQPAHKRVKLEHGEKAAKPKRTAKTVLELVDPFNVYAHTIRKNEDDDDDDSGYDPIHEAASELKETMGGKLTQLTISGIINGMAGIQGGLVKDKQNRLNPSSNIAAGAPVPSAGNATLVQLKHLATAVHQSVQTQVETDVLVTTPIRIKEMLAPDYTAQEFKAIRKRIYDTVILGKGLAQPEDLDIPTGSSTGVHDIEKFKKCKSCGNNDQSLFVLDKRNGDVICSNCGTVVSESLMHEGSQFRKFEGEIDRNHHGDTANPLYSNAHNMSTTLGGVQMTTGAGLGGFGSQKKGLEVVLRNAHAYTELNTSQFGKGDRRTRTGYKDKQKKDAFIQMTHCGDALNLHEAVIQRAKELFAGFRDDRQAVQQFKGVVAACICEAFDQLSSDGRQILKQKQEAPEENFNSARASRRNEFHHANLAGKGGILLDLKAVKKEKEDNLSSVAKKPASTWTLDDCRSWLMEASRSIAQQWISDRKNGNTKVPAGTQEELEGKLVEHAIALNDALEMELKQRMANQQNSRGRVITPRVNDMAKLGIKWQHGHERGSGGKGGVGGSGVHRGAAERSGRTAGQLLLSKTAKKLGIMLKDEFAGQSIHKELRFLMNRQEAQKRQLRREEASRQRLTQMKRKPWLQAIAQKET